MIELDKTSELFKQLDYKWSNHWTDYKETIIEENGLYEVRLHLATKGARQIQGYIIIPNPNTTDKWIIVCRLDNSSYLFNTMYPKVHPYGKYTYVYFNSKPLFESQKKLNNKIPMITELVTANDVGNINDGSLSLSDTVHNGTYKLMWKDSTELPTSVRFSLWNFNTNSVMEIPEGTIYNINGVLNKYPDHNP